MIDEINTDIGFPPMLYDQVESVEALEDTAMPTSASLDETISYFHSSTDLQSFNKKLRRSMIHADLSDARIRNDLKIDPMPTVFKQQLKKEVTSTGLF